MVKSKGILVLIKINKTISPFYNTSPLFFFFFFGGGEGGRIVMYGLFHRSPELYKIGIQAITYQTIFRL